ncbi:hypothetical protein HYALB_00007076 [Hymenoscyphus albidus]|uniref:Uncharacterized protein n=1 Tax=Hymenoscyphus albidus TaxID=595503 RepID=A0A9N9Q1C5_9HELO|nr:hypothetical protein HYALB_00007076 [Hymenoscyphus albidus]
MTFLMCPLCTIIAPPPTSRRQKSAVTSQPYQNLDSPLTLKTGPEKSEKFHFVRIMKEKTESTEHLLGDDGEEVTPKYSPRTGSMGSRVATFSSILSLILLSYISITLTIDIAKRQSSTDNDLPYCKLTSSSTRPSEEITVLTFSTAPANSVIRYERRSVWGGHTKYSGPPSAEVDDAWEELLEGLNVRGTKEELTLAGANQTNIVQLADKTGYPVVPLVYHHIHCLDSLRKLHYIEYFRNLGYDTTVTEEHFETLRKQVMCHADLALLNAEWVKPSDEENHIELRTNTESKCVNWDSIQSWAMERHLVQGGYKVIAGPFDKKKHKGNDR